ncbi:MAG: DNA double-strand break repair nuclease NurA, partial [Halobaculum sp.]
MTLDRIHVETITRLASAVAAGSDEERDTELAETVWTEFLNPLRADGRVVLEPLDDQRRRATPVEEAALADRPFPTSHGVDSGTLNPTAFKNGLVVDVAHAAMAADPSDLSVHAARSVLVTVHSPNPDRDPADQSWAPYDGGSSRRVLAVPRDRRLASETVHRLALALAESHHARKNLDSVEDLLYLDGPLYPKQLLDWVNRDRDRRRIAYGETVGEAVENYVRLVEACLDRGVPLVGFVKNPTSGFVVSTLASQDTQTPFQTDTGLYTRVLEPHDEGRDRLTFTSWFRSRGGPDAPLATDGDALGVERRRDPADYEVTFMLVYDPRTDVVFKAEAPYGVTRDPETRDALTTQIVSEVAANAGPPTPVAKADELARI